MSVGYQCIITSDCPNILFLLFGTMRQHAYRNTLQKTRHIGLSIQVQTSTTHSGLHTDQPGPQQLFQSYPLLVSQIPLPWPSGCQYFLLQRTKIIHQSPCFVSPQMEGGGQGVPCIWTSQCFEFRTNLLELVLLTVVRSGRSARFTHHWTCLVCNSPPLEELCCYGIHVLSAKASATCCQLKKRLEQSRVE